MPDLALQVRSAEPAPFAAAPTMNFALSVENEPADEAIQNILLSVQIQIAPQKRRYDPHEQARLLDLFGDVSRWGQTLRPLLWTHATAVVPPFSGATTFELPVPCTFDFNVSATKYFDALSEGDIPLLFLFSGTVFYSAQDGALQACRIAWSKEAKFRLPAATWRALMDSYYPSTAWLALRKDVFDRLAEHKFRNGFSSWESALEDLLGATEEPREELTSQ